MSGGLVIGGQLGNYLIESVVGRGGMSVVYRAVHSRLGTPVALKVLAPELSSDDAFRERFLREAKMAAAIDHPNVIPIYDTGLHEDSLYIVMRHVAGGDLKTLLTTSGPLDAERAVAVLMPVARALDAAHAHGLVHRDVKPANILLQRSPSGEVDHVYLSDFGVTKHASSISGLTRTGALVGTVDYMAPEQIEGREVSAQTDVYALACLFYQSVTGRVPYQRESEAAVLWAHMREDLEPASRVRPELPSSVDGPIARAVSKNPAARFATCEEFIRATSAPPEVGHGRLADLAGATVAETPPSSGDETAWPGLERSPEVTRPDHEPALAGGPPPPPRPPSGSGPGGPGGPGGSGGPDPSGGPERSGGPARSGGAGLGGWLSGHRWQAALLGLVVVGGIAAAAIALSSGGGSSSKSATEAGLKFPATLIDVPTNRVTATGDAQVRLKGNTVAATVNTNGLLDGSPHAMHIHAGGQGKCPPASAAHEHGGHLTISTVDGEPFYGPPVVSMTSKGDTGKNSILDFPRYPHVGNISYKRTFTVSSEIASLIRKHQASVILHGIDYNGNGIYDGVLDKSELNKHLSAEATAPGLCGTLVPAKGTKADAGSHVYTASLTLQASDPGLWLCHRPDARRTDPAREL